MSAILYARFPYKASFDNFNTYQYGFIAAYIIRQHYRDILGHKYTPSLERKPHNSAKSMSMYPIKNSPKPLKTALRTSDSDVCRRAWGSGVQGSDALFLKLFITRFGRIKYFIHIHATLPNNNRLNAGAPKRVPNIFSLA